ncbi:MAG TPA: PAS domain-containing protein [Vicinamibacterales bacterium]|nr:PAS domain-containing protein [Vicinamibacterales bacterium]
MLALAELQEIDWLSEQQLDALPFGVIGLDSDGKVIAYNAAEAQRAGFERSRVIGRNFFSDVAPCADVAQFREPFARGVERRELHVRFVFRFALPDRTRDVAITLFYSRRAEAVIVIVEDV